MEHNNNTYPALNELLKQSLFSRSDLMEGFSDRKALATIKVLKEYWTDQVNENSFILLIDNLLIESVARNVGHGENRGAGFPFDLIDKIENNFNYEINEALVLEVLYWVFGIKQYKLIKESTLNDDNFYFHNLINRQELILYSTFSNIAFISLKKVFNQRYNLICETILNEIPSKYWVNIIEKDQSIEDYL